MSSAATVFHWSPVFGARRYHLQVSDDPTFANVLDEKPIMGQASVPNGAGTDSTAYTSSTDYPTGTTLYWRVQAELEDQTSTVRRPPLVDDRHVPANRLRQAGRRAGPPTRSSS